MRTIVKGKNVEVPDRVREYAERKLDRLERLLDDRTDAIVELSNELHRSASDAHIAEVTLVIDGQILRSHAVGIELPGGPRRRRRQGRAPGGRPQGEAPPAGPSRGGEADPPAARRRHRGTAARAPDRQDQALRHRADVRGGRGRRDGGARPPVLRLRERRDRAGRDPVPAQRRRLRPHRADRRRRVHEGLAAAAERARGDAPAPRR